MNREDFIMLNKNIVYLDSASTSLKPKCVIDSMNDYYFNNTSNIHRGEYNEAILNNKLYDETKMEIAKFINCDKREVIYTSGCTSSINMFVLGYMKKYLKNGDVVLLSKSEHASNLLPWFNLSKEIGIKIKYIDLDSDYKLDYSSIDKLIKENNVKVISLAHITNVIGDIRDISYIGDICKKNNILFCVDAAQSIQHVKIDFKKYNISFLSFSSHKMMGPTGIGVLVGRYDLLEKNGLEKNVHFDFSILSFGDYYTGITIQGYTKGVGTPILEGGRYDNLISDGNVNKPACGFAININDLINKTKLTYERNVSMIYAKDKEKAMAKLAENSFVSLENSLDDAFVYGIANSIKEIIDIDNDKKYVLEGGKYICQE